MNPVFNKALLYPILDLDYCRLAGCAIETVLENWLANQTVNPVIQIRGKSLTRSGMEEIYNQVEKVFPADRIILNDFWDLAMDLGTGFHIGKEDYASLDSEQKKLVAEYTGIRGTSSHSLADIQNLENFWDYTGIGPVFPTSSKESGNTPLGSRFLKNALSISRVPLVAIGGISPANYEEILSAAAVTIAGISSFIEKDEYIKLMKIYRTNLSLS